MTPEALIEQAVRELNGLDFYAGDVEKGAVVRRAVEAAALAERARCLGILLAAAGRCSAENPWRVVLEALAVQVGEGRPVAGA